MFRGPCRGRCVQRSSVRYWGTSPSPASFYQSGLRSGRRRPERQSSPKLRTRTVLSHSTTSSAAPGNRRRRNVDRARAPASLRMQRDSSKRGLQPTAARGSPVEARLTLDRLRCSHRKHNRQRSARNRLGAALSSRCWSALGGPSACRRPFRMCRSDVRLMGS